MGLSFPIESANDGTHFTILIVPFLVSDPVVSPNALRWDVDIWHHPQKGIIVHYVPPKRIFVEIDYDFSMHYSRSWTSSYHHRLESNPPGRFGGNILFYRGQLLYTCIYRGHLLYMCIYGGQILYMHIYERWLPCMHIYKRWVPCMHIRHLGVS
jgi:hypothetical protein